MRLTIRPLSVVYLPAIAGALWLVPLPASSQTLVFQCQQANGHWRFSDAPCERDEASGQHLIEMNDPLPSAPMMRQYHELLAREQAQRNRAGQRQQQREQRRQRAAWRAQHCQRARDSLQRHRSLMGLGYRAAQSQSLHDRERALAERRNAACNAR